MTRRFIPGLTASYTIFLIMMLVVLLAAFWLRTEHLSIYPPGVSNDEGVDVIDAFHVARTGVYPLYQDLGRPEPLYVMLETLAVALFGPGVWSMRLITALVGVLSVAAAYWCTTQCLRDMPPIPRRMAGVAAAIVLTTAVGHLTLSRAIYRAILLPPGILLLTGFLMRGLRTGRTRDFVLCGVFTGLTLYTYTAGYVVPVAFAPLLLSLLIFRWKRWRMWLPCLLLAGVVAGVVLLPVVIRLLSTPESVLGRASAVSGRNYGELIKQLPQILPQLFFGEGDQNPQYNAARAPLIPEVFQALFVLGLVALIIRIRQPSSLFLAALLLLGTVPVLLTEEIPHGLRIAGEFGIFPVVIGSAIGVIVLLALRIFENRLILAVGSLVLLAGLAYQGLKARAIYADYWDNSQNYRMWTMFDYQLTHNEWFFRVDRRKFADWLVAQDYPMLLPMEEAVNITTHAWLLRDYPEVDTAGDDFTLPSDTRLVLPWAISRSDVMRDTRDFVLLHDHTITLMPPLTGETQAALVEDIDAAEKIGDGEGQLDFLGYVKPLPETFMLEFEPKMTSVSALYFGGGVNDSEIYLSGAYGLTQLSGKAQQVEYTLDWSTARRLGHDYWSYLQLLTQDYQKLASSSDDAILRWLYPSTQWSTEDAVPVRYTLDVPDLAPGAYRLVTGVYPPFGEKLPAMRAVDGDASDSPTVAWVKVAQPDAPVPGDNAVTVDAVAGDVFRLNAVEAVRLSDTQIQINLYWQALENRPNIDATVFVHVVDASGTIIAQSDIRPWNGQYPTFIWDAGETVRTEHVVNVDSSVTEFTLRAGMYTFPGPQNLPVVQDGVQHPDGLITLDKIEAAP